jgi:hypothetical protein
MATRDITPTAARARTSGDAMRTRSVVSDETKLSLKTTEFWAMVATIVAVLVAAAVSDTLGDVRAWTLVAAVAIGYMISRGLAKAGSRYRGSEDPLNRDG